MSQKLGYFTALRDEVRFCNKIKDTEGFLHLGGEFNVDIG